MCILLFMNLYYFNVFEFGFKIFSSSITRRYVGDVGLGDVVLFLFLIVLFDVLCVNYGVFYSVCFKFVIVVFLFFKIIGFTFAFSTRRVLTRNVVVVVVLFLFLCVCLCVVFMFVFELIDCVF